MIVIAAFVQRRLAERVPVTGRPGEPAPAGAPRPPDEWVVRIDGEAHAVALGRLAGRGGSPGRPR